MATQKKSQPSEAAVGNFCSEVQRCLDQLVCSNRRLSMVQAFRCIGVHVGVWRFGNSIGAATGDKSMVRQKKCECEACNHKDNDNEFAAYKRKSCHLLNVTALKQRCGWGVLASLVITGTYEPHLCCISTLCIAIEPS